MIKTTDIRMAEPTDDSSVIQLLIQTFSNLYRAMGVEMSAQREAYLRDQSNRRTFASTFLYEVDGEAAGTVTLVPPSSKSEAWIEGAWDLRLLAVDPDMQGRGVARALITYAENRARAAGATAMCLHARRGVASQARLYLGCDYVRDPAGDMDGQPYQEGYHKYL